MCYFQACGKQSESFYIIFVLVLTTVLDHSQVGTTSRGDSWINVSQLGTPKHTPHLHPGHRQDQPTTLLSRGPGPRPNWDSKPRSWVLDSVRCLDLHPKTTPNSRSGKSQNPRQESNKSSRSHKQVCAQDNKSVTWLPYTATDGP
jgi:hypothetical protein